MNEYFSLFLEGIPVGMLFAAFVGAVALAIAAIYRAMKG